MADMSIIGGLIASLNLAKDIAKTMVAVRDAEAFQAKLWEFNGAMIDTQASAISVQQEHAALLKRVGELEEEVAALKDWKAEKQRYQLEEPYSGLYAYAVKPAMQGVEPFHRLCAHCYQRGEKSILQTVREPEGNLVEWKCRHCKQALRLPIAN